VSLPSKSRGACETMECASHRTAMPCVGTHARYLALERAVVGLPDAFHARLDFPWRRLSAIAIERLAIEGVDWAEARRVASRIEVLATRRAVHVHHIARVRCNDRRGAQCVQKIVEAGHVPVGVGPEGRDVMEAPPERARHEGARVRHRTMRGEDPRRSRNGATQRSARII
jgi:hypothetical protein